MYREKTIILKNLHREIRKNIQKIYVISIITIVSLLVLAPPLYIVFYVLIDLQEVWGETFNQYIVGAGYWRFITRSVELSLRLAITTLIVDLLIGLPLSYFLARKKILARRFLEDVAVLPLVVPTSAYGFAILMTWSNPSGLASFLGLSEGLIPQNSTISFLQVPTLLLLTHIALTLPYIIRPLTATIETLGETYELVSRSLGASALTTFRRITLPIILPSLLSSSVLVLTRSLGETGATIIVAGVNITASVAIVRLAGAMKLGLASLLASLLIASTLALVLPTESISKKVAIRREVKPSRVEKVLLKLESNLATRKYIAYTTKSVLTIILALLTLAPIAAIVKVLIEYWERDPYTGKIEGGVLYQVFGPSGYWTRILRAAANSFLVASLATLTAVYVSILLFAAVRRSKLASITRGIIRIPLIVPTSAQGLSSLLLYGRAGLNLAEPSIWLTVLTHISFTTPVVFETLMATYETVDVDVLEDVARTLGATPYDGLETITLPVLKKGIVAGSVLAFLGSLGETGATMMVMGRDEMLTVLVVNMAEALAIPAALFTSTLLLVYAVVALFAVRFLTQ
ncbi:MAG: ABC transporter permease subunit [Thermofilaceae archaeon]